MTTTCGHEINLNNINYVRLSFSNSIIETLVFATYSYDKGCLCWHDESTTRENEPAPEFMTTVRDLC